MHDASLGEHAAVETGDSSKQDSSVAETSAAASTAKGRIPPRTAQRRYDPPPVNPSRVVSKPQALRKGSQRDFELNQLRRRFSPAENSTTSATILALKLHPTDPDFPFDLNYLDCILQVPVSYPDAGTPTLNVRNLNMERGFQINIEQGFDSIIKAAPDASLLAYMNTLDRQLEGFLSGDKANTIKIIANARKVNDQIPTMKEPKSSVGQESYDPKIAVTPEPTYSPLQRAAAATRREAETRQLEARLGRQSLFAKSSDGIAYTLPIEPRRRWDMPVPLQPVKSLRLFVPMLYPLIPCRIALQGVARDAALATEKAFEKKARESSGLTLMGHVNFLATNMHDFASEPVSNEDSQDMESEFGFESIDLSDVEPPTEPDRGKDQEANLDDRTHIRVIPRPPEWDQDAEAGRDGDSDTSQEQGEASSEDEPEETTDAPGDGPERGISINFPDMELHGIELLDLTSLSVSIKCLRCKESMDVSNLRQQPKRHETCKKCASILSFGTFDPHAILAAFHSLITSIGYRKDYMHAQALRAGHVDLDGCTVTDLLPRLVN